MRMTALFRGATLAAVVLGLNITTQLMSAQSVFDRAKRAAQEAAQKAREKQQQPQPPPQASQPPNQPKSTAAASEAPTGDCCSPDALKKIASSVGFVDIVGVKLGMSPEQAFAAIKAFNGRMQIEIVNARMESPDGPLGNFTRVPQFAVAHTIGARPIPHPIAFRLADGSSDVIVLEFTTPPSPPLVAKIVRQVFFAQAEPVVKSNLLEALRKKYGQEKFSEGVAATWMFDASGKPVTRPLQEPEKRCLPANIFGGNFWHGTIPEPPEMSQEPPINVALLEQTSPERSPVCLPFTFVTADSFGEATPPNQQMSYMTVGIQSPALLYGSRKATHDWLKAKGDAKTKQLDDAAKARSAPKL